MMKTLLKAASDQFERVAWRRACQADEARWEAQIRRMAGRSTKDSEMPVVVRTAPVRTTLEVAADVTRRDALFMPRRLPTFSGIENEDLVCGKCAGVIGFGISSATARRRHPEGERLVVRCICGALNRLA
jgi:hypothetical protein